MIGEWVQIPKWNCYLADTRELTMSIYVLFVKREKGAEIQKNHHGRKEPCKSIDDTRTCECNFIGVSGRAKNPRHHQLSKILSLREYFDPMILDEYVMFRGNGTPFTPTEDGRADCPRFAGGCKRFVICP
jgi:hypothetical protein